MMPSRQTFTLFAVISCGLTLIGATTYFVATRLMRKKRAAKALLETEDDAEYYDISDDEDIREMLSRERKRRGRASAYRPPPLITFAELFEQALHIHQ
jgi:hypothetical protein